MSIGVENLKNISKVPTADASTNVYTRDVVGIKTDAAVTTVGTVATLVAYIKGLLNEIAKIPKSDKVITIVQDTETGTPDVVTATSSATANTFGSWVTVDASAAADCWISHITVLPATADEACNWCIEIGTGASPAAKIRLSGGLTTVSAAGHDMSIPFAITYPVKVASGTAISVRASDSHASANNYSIGVSFAIGL